MLVILTLTAPNLGKQFENERVLHLFCSLKPLAEDFSTNEFIEAPLRFQAVIDDSETSRIYTGTKNFGDTIPLNEIHRDVPIIATLYSYPKIPVHIGFFRIDMFCAYWKAKFLRIRYTVLPTKLLFSGLL